jgi:hypothetical protein
MSAGILETKNSYVEGLIYKIQGFRVLTETLLDNGREAKLTWAVNFKYCQ